MKILVLGSKGLAGSNILKYLETSSHLTFGLSRQDVDLLNENDVIEKFIKIKPDVVIGAASKVGGMMANSKYPAEFLLENLRIQNNMISAAYKSNIEKLIFFGSSCIYPANSPQPIKEEYLLTNVLEKTNEAYAIAKIAGLKLVEAFVSEYGRKWFSIMPTNLYGPGDNFDLENSHVLAAVIRKFYDAKNNGNDNVQFWGTGKPRREFMHISDFASAVVYLMENYHETSLINVGTGEDISILELVEKVAEISKFTGEIIWDKSKPDGTFQKKLDVSKLNSIGWKPKITLDKGLQSTYSWFAENYKSARLKVPILKF